MELKVNLTNKLFQAGLRVVKFLQENGFESFWVGGIIRNILLKRESDNIDIATDATPDEIEKVFRKANIHTKPVGKQFGSILAIVNGFKIEITTFRAEGRYSDKRHPDQVQFIKDYLNDAKRRDFTINALYFDPVEKQLYDPSNGLRDLRLKLLRFVGDPKKRIDEDALRMLRGVRLATQLGFRFEKNSFAAIKTRAKYIQDVSGERIKAEIDKILLSKNRSEGLRLLDKVGLLRFIIPEFEALKTFSHGSKLYHLEGSIFEHTLLALSKIKDNNLDLIYAILFHDIGKPKQAQRVLKKEGWVISTHGHADVGADIFLKFASRLKFPKQSRSNVEWLIRNHMLMFDFSQMRPVKQLALAQHLAFELLLKHWGLDEAATQRAQYADDHHRRYLKSLAVGKKYIKELANKGKLLKHIANGDLIMKHSGLKPGKQLGEKILQVKAKVILGEIKNEIELKKYLSARGGSAFGGKIFLKS